MPNTHPVIILNHTFHIEQDRFPQDLHKGPRTIYEALQYPVTSLGHDIERIRESSQVHDAERTVTYIQS